jgi:hypothetical protein
MKATFAIAWLLLLVPCSVQGQFVLLEQERSVTARAELSQADYPLPGQDFHVVDEQTREASDFSQFDESVTAHLAESNWLANGTAWQRSALSPMRILSSGGPQDVDVCCNPGIFLSSAEASSATRIVFRVDVPTQVRLLAEIFDPPDYFANFDYYRSGDVSFSLTGPNLTILQGPNNELIDNGSVQLPPPTIIDQTRWLELGTYELNVSAEYGSTIDPSFADAYYDIDLAVLVIPEPASIVLVVSSLILLTLGRRYVLAHFGK